MGEPHLQAPLINWESDYLLEKSLNWEFINIQIRSNSLRNWCRIPDHSKILLKLCVYERGGDDDAADSAVDGVHVLWVRSLCSVTVTMLSEDQTQLGTNSVLK